MRKELFFLTATYYDILAGTNQIKQIQTDKDARVEVNRLSRSLVDTFGDPINPNDILEGQQQPALSVWIYDNAIGEYLSNAPVPVVNLFGSGMYAGYLAQPLLLGKNAVLSITVYNNYNTYGVGYLQLAFIGKKVFDR